MDLRHRIIDRSFALALCAAALVVGGCRQNQASRELLERELRLQEDRIYQLEAQLDDTQHELMRLRGCGPGERLDDRGVDDDRRFAPPASLPPPSTALPPPSTSLPPPTTSLPPPTTSLPPPSTSLPPPSAPQESSGGSAPPFRGPPAVVPVDPNVPEGIPGRRAQPPSSPLPPPDAAAARDLPGEPYKSMSSPRFLSPSQKPRAPDEFMPPETAGRVRAAPIAGPTSQPAPIVAPSSSRIHSLTIGRGTGGASFDAVPGDDGVRIIVEARNVRGETTAEPVAASIVLIDPAITGEGGRYARWDFTPDDAAALYRPADATGPGGLVFELPWPDAPPAHARLKLFVRLTTADGRQLQAESDLTIDAAQANSAALPEALKPTRADTPTTVIPAAAPTIAPLRWGRDPDGGESVGEVPGELPLETREAAERMPPLDPPQFDGGPMLVPAK